LVGIAIEQGKIDGVNGNLLDFFPQYTDIANLDDRKESITLEHLLTMTAGFTWDELSIPYVDSEGNPNYENDAVKMGASDDWIQHMLNLPMSDEPGAQWTYNSGCTILLSGIIKKKTGQSAEAFAKKNLFTKIGITDWEWEMGPDGIANTGWGLSLYPVDMAMFGYLFLKNGQLNGKQIVPEDWVSESTREHITIIYGYQWWVLPDNMITGHPEANGIFYALGYGGQTIMILPTIDMVIVTTAWNPGQEGFRFDILLDILSAVKEK
jgi:CubicO group peptidase (beta-lactamase class C family)